MHDDIKDGSVKPARRPLTARTWFLWTVAVIVTLASVAFQRISGPSFPVFGSAKIAGTTVHYMLPKSHAGAGDAVVAINNPGGEIGGSLQFRRYRSGDMFSSAPMMRENGRLAAKLPHQPPAGKLEYSITLRAPGETVVIPKDGRIVIRFRGDVPLWAMIPHILFMFLALLFSTRTALELLNPTGRIRRLAWYTLATLIIGGLVFGPIVQHYSFGDWWTGIPFGHDLTDNKTLIAFIAWMSACATLGKRGRKQSRAARRHTLVAWAIMFIVFLIPHSMFGSELNYAKEAPAHGHGVTIQHGKPGV